VPFAQKSSNVIGHDRVPSLAQTPLTAVEDRIWEAIVTLVPLPGIDSVFAKLSADGVPIAAISNATFSGRTIRSELARHGLADQLRFVLSSADVGARKPLVAMFTDAVERIGVAADRTWFVGDTIDEDIAGAIAAGLQPILFLSKVTSGLAGPTVPVVRNWAEFMSLYTAARVGLNAG
jgi:FMN phosphatase YigB (HAD superfamily)